MINMEETFENLKKTGKNTVDDIIKWMKDAKIIDKAKEAEEKARKLFQGVPDVKNIDLAKFKDVIAKIAEEQKKTVEDLNKKLAEESPKLLEAAKAGVSALKDVFNKK